MTSHFNEHSEAAGGPLLGWGMPSTATCVHALPGRAPTAPGRAGLVAYAAGTVALVTAAVSMYNIRKLPKIWRLRVTLDREKLSEI